MAWACISAWILRKTQTTTSPFFAAKQTRFAAPFHHNSVAFFCNRESSSERRTSADWLTLPSFVSRTDVSTMGKRLLDDESQQLHTTPPTTALKWVAHCCPEMPHSLIQKLFRLRQVRVECMGSNDSLTHAKQDIQKPVLKRIPGKEIMRPGMTLYLPKTVCTRKVSKEKQPGQSKNINPTADDINHIRSLELYKDSHIIVLNKPYGLPVQGGPGIRKSMDLLASAALSYDYEDAPRLVHRLDKDCSGVLVMARTKESAVLLHSLFREKTNMVSSSEDPSLHGKKLKRRYWALVIGTLSQKQGRIAAPLTKVVSNDKTSERILIANDVRENVQEAVTDYRVIDSTAHGLTWLELCTFTGRKHQVRVHCAEALGTPILGDYKYGWSAHRDWIPMSLKNTNHKDHELQKKNAFVLEDGSVLSKKPFLHLHCRQLSMPNIAKILEQPDKDHSETPALKFVASLPSHMSTSWEYMSSYNT